MATEQLEPTTEEVTVPDEEFDETPPAEEPETKETTIEEPEDPALEFTTGGTDEDDDDEDSTDKNLYSKFKSEKDEELEKKIDETQETKKETEKAPVLAKKERDYTGLSEDEKKLFKNMSNEAYEKLLPLYKEKKSGVKPVEVKAEEVKETKTVWDHPEAYILDPDYQKIAGQANSAERILEHWQQQLINIRTGKDWTLINIDAQGNIIQAAAQPSDAQGEMVVNKALMFAQNQLLQKNTELNTFATKHQIQYQSDVETVKQKELEFFPNWDAEDHPTKSLQTEMLNRIPASMRKHPLANYVKKLAANVLVLQAQLKQKPAPPAAIKKEKTQTPPRKVFRGGSDNKKSGINFNDFEAIKG